MTAVVFADLVDSTGIYERLGDVAASRFVTGFIGGLTQALQGHGGRIVKMLGDGVFAVFGSEDDALAGCMATQRKLADTPVFSDVDGRPVRVRIGIDSGDVIDIDGDCFGDAVNSAARLADLAGPAQILTTQAVHDGLSPAFRRHLRSLGPMFLRGKSASTVVFSVELKAEADGDATVMNVGLGFRRAEGQALSLEMGSRRVLLAATGAPCSIGRAPTSGLQVDDGRVSRLHAIADWRAGQFVLSDVSTFGTWVYVGDQTDPIVLRRSQCVLVGAGRIFLGCDSTVPGGPVVTFSVKAAA